MPTYRQILEFIQKKYHCTVKTCHIAHVKRDRGYRMRPRVNKGPLKYPCPERFRPWIEQAFDQLYSPPRDK